MLPLAVVSVIGLAVCVALGYWSGGTPTAYAAALGMAAAIVGGVAGMLVISLTGTPGDLPAATPMLAMTVRLLVTAAAVGFVIVGLQLPHRPVLFAALLGYLGLMAIEAAMLYRLASRPRAAAGQPAEPPDA